MKNNLINILALFIIVVSVIGCKHDLAEYADFSELGTANRSYTIPSEAGSVNVKVLSNTSFEVIVPHDNSWLVPSKSEYFGDSEVNFEYTENTGFARMSAVAIFASQYNRYDTIYIKQKGAFTAQMEFPKLNTTVLGDGGAVSAELNTNVPFELIDVLVVYPDLNEEPWINDDFSYNISDSRLNFTVKPNPHQVNLRSAQIKLTFIDGWGEKVISTLYLLQANANNEFGTQVNFLDVREWAGERITSDIYIEGHVISDPGNPNASEYQQTTNTNINYAINDRVVYIQSVDGKYGFKVIAATAGDNVFQRFSKVQLLLKGTSISKESNPDFYTINGLTSMMVMNQQQGTASQLAVKQKHISELNDNDIFTYVTLENMEFPIRKGSFTPINEGYSTLFDVHRIAKYPLLMRDINGDQMFLMTNTKVPYRRDGALLPYGSGSISGVLVHEKFVKFEYEDAVNEDQYGNIGRYQLRHLTRNEIQINSDFNQGFSGIISEFQYPDIVNGVARATYGNGTIRSSVPTINLSKNIDYTYLGPVGRTYLGNTNQFGNGVMLGNSKQNTEVNTNSDGKGPVTNSAIVANPIWWNEAQQRGEAFILEFSTLGITTDQLSLQFAIANLTGGTGKGAPRYWKAEWSEHGDMNRSWNMIAPFTVTDMPFWNNTTMHQLAAYKNIGMRLPLEMLGKSSVFIRLIVDRNLASDGNSYASVPILAISNTGLSYLGVRYNK